MTRCYTAKKRRNPYSHYSIKMTHDPDTNDDLMKTPVISSYMKPEEFDIYVNKLTMETYIFHGKKMEQDVDYLEYDATDHSVTVVKKDGAQLDLGVKIQWLIRPYFTKTREISIVQTKDGHVVDGYIVPLIHRTQE